MAMQKFSMRDDKGGGSVFLQDCDSIILHLHTQIPSLPSHDHHNQHQRRHSESSLSSSKSGSSWISSWRSSWSSSSSSSSSCVSIEEDDHDDNDHDKDRDGSATHRSEDGTPRKRPRRRSNRRRRNRSRRHGRNHRICIFEFSSDWEEEDSLTSNPYAVLSSTMWSKSIITSSSSTVSSLSHCHHHQFPLDDDEEAQFGPTQQRRRRETWQRWFHRRSSHVVGSGDGLSSKQVLLRSPSSSFAGVGTGRRRRRYLPLGGLMGRSWFTDPRGPTCQRRRRRQSRYLKDGTLKDGPVIRQGRYSLFTSIRGGDLVLDASHLSASTHMSL